MNELDKLIKEAVHKEVESQGNPNSKKMWKNIGRVMGLSFNKRKKFGLKVAIIVSALVLVFYISLPTSLEALPFGSFFHNVIKEYIDETRVNIRHFFFGESDVPEHIREVTPEDTERIHTGDMITETNIEELLGLYEGDFYFFKDASLEDVQRVYYYEIDASWVIYCDLLINNSSITFMQRDLSDKKNIGKTYDVDDTEVYFERTDGIEYMISRQRFDVVEIEWIYENKLFKISSTLDVERMLEMAQSVIVFRD